MNLYSDIDQIQISNALEQIAVSTVPTKVIKGVFIIYGRGGGGGVVVRQNR